MMPPIRHVKLEYQLASRVELEFDRTGWPVKCVVDGKDCTENGQTVENVLQEIKNHGHVLELDLSLAWEAVGYFEDNRVRAYCWWTDAMYV